jgi:aromatic ring-opening dioxygenase catalytic subunit (LigB family)
MMQTPRQPAIFVSHGGGPCFWMTPSPLVGPHGFDRLKAYLAGLLNTLPARPKAILVVSGHWEERLPTVSTAAAPPMLFDYYGFPEHTYHLSYPAPGAPDVAAQVHALLTAAGIAAATDPVRGFDHGVFVPFLIVDPEARIPVVMLSLQQSLDPAFHIAVGRAIAPLREEGVLIVGSGNSFHNLRAFFDGRESPGADAFHAWLDETVSGTNAARRKAGLEQWAEAPHARECHPREEHLLPLMVVAGAALDDVGRRVYHDRIAGKPASGFAFG